MNAVMARFRPAIELHEAMVAMHRQLLIREHPEETHEQIDRRLEEWVVHQEPPRRRVLESDA